MSYHDGAPLSEEKLQGSRLLVKAEAVLATGGRVTVLEIVVRRGQDHRPGDSGEEGSGSPS